MKVLLAPNSFKNSLSSVQITDLLSSQLSKIKNAEIIESPISDGGDGFIEVLEYYKKESFDKYFYEAEFNGEPIKCPVLFDRLNKTIYLESASAIGLRFLKKEELNPLNLNSFSIGHIIKNILFEERQKWIPPFKNMIIGVGGTATIDFGLGAVNSLGVKFFDYQKNEVKPVPGNFNLIKEIGVEDLDSNPYIQSLREKNIFCIVDVDTKLLGKNNALEIFGPQKGANKKDIDLISSGVRNVISVLKKKNYPVDELSLNGAGGGLASGLSIFFGAKIIPAKDYISAELLKSTNSEIPDYVITAEGRFDYQSFEGKATGEIIKNFSSKVKKIFVICGLAEDKVDKKLPDNVEIIQIRDYFHSVDESITNASLGIKIASEKILNQLSDISSN